MEHAFAGCAGKTSLISDYIHAIIEHLAYLIAKRGPLGYWSQQAIEAAHKILKEAWARCSAHDGGRGQGARNKSIEQIMKKSARQLLGRIRIAAASTEGKSDRQRAWGSWVAHEVRKSCEEHQIAEATHRRCVKRIKRRMVRDLREEEGVRKKLRAEKETGKLGL